jgi:hypothetical protein
MSSIEIKNNQSESSSKNMIINENNLEISEELKSDYKEKENSIKNENLSNINEQIDKFNINNPQIDLNEKNKNEIINIEQNIKKEFENSTNDIKNNNNSNDTSNILKEGKFMQINPHINLLNNHINMLRDGIYDNTKKVLTLKSSLLDSRNFIKKNSNSVIMDLVNKLYDFRKAMANENVGVKEEMVEVEKQFNLQLKLHKKLVHEVKNCENKINHLENIVGSHLLENPNYDFMKKIKKNEENKNNQLTHI